MSNKLIGLILPNLTNGGAERVSLNLARALMARGYSVYLFLLKEKVEFSDVDGLNIINLNSQLGFTLGRTAKSKKYALILSDKIRELETHHDQPFDLLVSNLNKAHDVCVKLEHPSLRFCFHNSISHYVKLARKQGYFKYKWLLKLYKHMSNADVIAVSQGVAKEIRETSFLNPKKLTVIYNPFSVEDIQRKAVVSIDQAKIPANTKYIINVARPVAIKRHDLLLDALKHVGPEYKLVLVGNNTEKLNPLIKSKGLVERVIVMGLQKNPYPLIKNAELLVLSSDNEGFGAVLIESLICGTPAVSTDCEWGPSEILTGELSNCLTPVGDPKALGEKMNEILASKPKIGRVEILDKISYETVIPQYLSFPG